MWKEIKGYEGLYEVSENGEVRSRPRKGSAGGLMKSHKDAKGYLVLGLTKQGRQTTKRIHRLVAEAFLPNPDNLPEVNHKDEDKTNNCVSNLEWCTTQYNHDYGTRTQRAAETQCRKIRCVETGEEFNSITEAALSKGVDRSGLSKVCQGKLHELGGYHWCYAEDENPDTTKRKNCRAVLCVETQEAFPSAKVASENKGCDASGITKVCRGKGKTCGGYHWQYVDE